MEQSSSQTNISLVRKVISHILWNTKVHKSPPLLHTLSQINPVDALPYNFLHVLCLPNRLYPSGFSTKSLYLFLSTHDVLHALPISPSLIWLPELAIFKTLIRFLLTYVRELQHKVTLSLDGDRTLGLADNVLQLATSHCCDHGQAFSAVFWHTAYDVTYHNNKPALSPSTCRCDISCGFHWFHRPNFPQQSSRCSSDINSDSTSSM